MWIFRRYDAKLNVQTAWNRAGHILFSFLNNHEYNDDGVSSETEILPEVSRRPHRALSLSSRTEIKYTIDNLQSIAARQTAQESTYIFGRIDPKTIGFTHRAGDSVTPNFTVEFYGQPFVSSGNYPHLKKITTPRAELYEDRFNEYTGDELAFNPATGIYTAYEPGDTAPYSFSRPDFNFQQFSSNPVIRWEYSPGSTVFLVWNQGGTAPS